MPGNIATYYRRLKPIATFNIVQMLQKLTDLVFKYDTLQQLKLRERIIVTAQFLNISYHNALKNLGNFLFLLSFYFFNVFKIVIWFVMMKIASKKLDKNKYRKKINALKKALVFNQIISLCIAGFIPISLAVYFQLRAPLFTTPGEIYGVIAGVICFALVFLLLPYALIVALFVDRQTLDDPEFKQRWGVAYSGIKLETRWQRAYKLIFIARRFALLYIGLEMHEMPALQLFALNNMNVAAIIYLCNNQPLPTRHAMRMEIFNEVMVATTSYHLFMFTDALPSVTAQYLMGWSLVLNITLMLATNSFFVVKDIVNNLKPLFIKKWRVLTKSSKKEEEAAKPNSIQKKADEQEAEQKKEAERKSSLQSIK